MSSTNHNLSQRSSSFRGPWRHEPINSVSFHPLTSPRAAPRGCRAPSNVLHISSGSTGAGWKWPLGHRIPPRYYGHRSLFPLNPTLKQEKKDLWSKKKVWFLKHILCFYSSLFLSFSLFLFISQEKTFFFLLLFEYCSKYINHRLVWLNEHFPNPDGFIPLAELKMISTCAEWANGPHVTAWTCLSQAGTKSHKLWISPRDSFRYASLLSNLFTIVLPIKK